jgi:hypothetical protein
MRGISIKAVLLGAFADIATSTLFGVAFGIYVVSSRGLTDLHKDALRSAVVTAVHSSPALYAAQLLIGFGASILGGYVAASLVKESKPLNAILASWLCVGIGIHALITGQDGISPAMVVFMIALTPLCYVLGGKLQAKRKVSRLSPA